MASYLLPRRGAYSSISSTVLKQGEIFFETPNGVGGGKGRIMMGNGSNSYNALAGSSKYFLDVDSSPVVFGDVTASDSTALNTLAGSLTASGISLPMVIRVLKRALYNTNALLAGKAASSHTHKNSEISNLAFGTYVYSGSAVSSFYFSHASLKGFSYVILQAQDAGGPIQNASIDSSTGKITVRLTVGTTTCRVCYCAFKIE